MELRKGQRVICVNADWSAAIEHQPRLIDTKLPVHRAPYYIASSRLEVHRCGSPGCAREGQVICWVTIVGLDPQLNFDGSRFCSALDDRSLKTGRMTDISGLQEIARTTKLPEEGLMSASIADGVSQTIKDGARLLRWLKSRKTNSQD